MWPAAAFLCTAVTSAQRANQVANYQVANLLGNSVSCHPPAYSAVLKQGYVSDGPKAVPCKRGTYKNGFNGATTCQSCPDGVTTNDVASTDVSACKVLKPGYYPKTWAGSVTEAKLCPQKM
jgi:hypothetical protein